MAIQLIINREWGLAKNENPNQGAFIIDELTELVEEAVLAEFETHRRARRRARRDGDRLPARQDPGREHALRDAQAHRRVPDHRRQHLPQPARRPGARAHRAGALDRGREAEPADAAARLPRAPRRRGAGDAQAPAAGGDRQPQRVRGADGRGARLLAGADHRTRCSRSAASTGAACKELDHGQSALRDRHAHRRRRHHRAGRRQPRQQGRPAGRRNGRRRRAELAPSAC